MQAALVPDFDATIRYALTSRPGAGGEVEIVLDLFRGAAPALTRSIASVRACEAALLLARCGRHLECLGAHAVMPPAAEPGADWAGPPPACDWRFVR